MTMQITDGNVRMNSTSYSCLTSDIYLKSSVMIRVIKNVMFQWGSKEIFYNEMEVLTEIVCKGEPQV